MSKRPNGTFGNCHGSRVIRWLYREPCEPCRRARLRKHNACAVHSIVEWLADELGVIVIGDAGFYGDGVLDVRPWRWRGGLFARYWTSQFVRAIRADVRTGRLPNVRPWNSV